MHSKCLLEPNYLPRERSKCRDQQVLPCLKVGYALMTRIHRSQDIGEIVLALQIVQDSPAVPGHDVGIRVFQRVHSPVRVDLDKVFSFDAEAGIVGDYERVERDRVFGWGEDLK